MQKKPFREGRAHTTLHQVLADFLKESSHADVFITISYIDLNKAGTVVTVCCSIFPEERQEQTYVFLKQNERQCYDYLQQHTALRVTPAVRFTLAKKQVF